MALFLYGNTNMYSGQSGCPSWSARNTNFDEFYQIEVFDDRNYEADTRKNLDEILNMTSYKCHVCNIEVPKSYKKEHVKSDKHEICLEITNIALERTHMYMKADVVEPSLKLRVEGTYFCEHCAVIVEDGDRDKHNLTRKHLNSVENDEKLLQLLNVYKDSQTDMDVDVDSFSLSENTLEQMNSKFIGGISSDVRVTSNKVSNTVHDKNASYKENNNIEEDEVFAQIAKSEKHVNISKDSCLSGKGNDLSEANSNVVKKKKKKKKSKPKKVKETEKQLNTYQPQITSDIIVAKTENARDEKAFGSKSGFDIQKSNIDEEDDKVITKAETNINHPTQNMEEPKENSSASNSTFVYVNQEQRMKGNQSETNKRNDKEKYHGNEKEELIKKEKDDENEKHIHKENHIENDQTNKTDSPNEKENQEDKQNEKDTEIENDKEDQTDKQNKNDKHDETDKQNKIDKEDETDKQNKNDKQDETDKQNKIDKEDETDKQNKNDIQDETDNQYEENQQDQKDKQIEKNKEDETNKPNKNDKEDDTDKQNKNDKQDETDKQYEKNQQDQKDKQIEKNKEDETYKQNKNDKQDETDKQNEKEKQEKPPTTLTNPLCSLSTYLELISDRFQTFKVEAVTESKIALKIIGGETVVIPLMNFHGYVKDGDGVVCRLCRGTGLINASEHQWNTRHMDNVMITVDENFMRKLDETLTHCIICNSLHLTAYSGFHVRHHDHISNKHDSQEWKRDRVARVMATLDDNMTDDGDIVTCNSCQDRVPREIDLILAHVKSNDHIICQYMSPSGTKR